MSGNMQSDAVMDPKFGIGSVTRFYVPLLLQGFSQSLAYPLVAGIVTHGALGVDALTAFSQGQMVMFTIGAIGGGLDLDVAPARPSGEFLHHELRHRRPTDVPVAQEQYLRLVIGVFHCTAPP